MLEPYNDLAELSVQKVLHVREHLFIVLYSGGLIEMRDLSCQSTKPVYSFRVPRGDDEEERETMDVDFKEDERNLVIAFKD